MYQQALRPGFARAPGRRRQWRQQVKVADTQRLGEFEYGHHGGIALASLKATQILLAETGLRLDLLLGEAQFAPDAREISAHNDAHVHVDCMPNTHYVRYLL